ncbi:MAG: aminotransferase class I/II-fold pyridoxal phosphate-dependent enzyme, partial [Oscillospiraceae bacterium]
YGEPMGVPEMRAIFADMLGVKSENVIAGGNSSLNLMFDTISRAYIHGLPHSEKPWCKYEQIKFLCPSPGYDRHFAVTEHFGAKLIAIPMLDDGPDMDEVERLVASDDTVKGMWCVPVYSNPTGCVYSDKTIERMAKMKCAAPDFTIMWDNAYCVHTLYGEVPVTADILGECERAGCPERVLLFASTSKITFAGAGVSCIAGSTGSITAIKTSMAIQTIGFDKVNQLMHARYLQNFDGVVRHMMRHAELLLPKFQMVDRILSEQLDGSEVASWTKPSGGYFISLFADGGAKRVITLCANAGVKLTGAGAAYPYGIDPDDRHIRIAPTYPSLDELEKACGLLALCVKIAALEKLTGLSVD